MGAIERLYEALSHVHDKCMEVPYTNMDVFMYVQKREERGRDRQIDLPTHAKYIPSHSQWQITIFFVQTHFY